jgi:hypothetical protein
MLTFKADEEYDDRWRADLGRMVPWPKLREIIDWLNEAEFKEGWRVEATGVARSSPQAGAFAYQVRIMLDSTEERDAFETRWGNWF